MVRALHQGSLRAGLICLAIGHFRNFNNPPDTTQFMSSATFFISAVSDEFGTYREAVRAALDRPGVRVETQETFLAHGDRTLPMLDEYIRQCDAVIHLFGERTGREQNGGVASAVNVDALLAARPDLPAKLGVDEAFLLQRSYTQWEAWLAIYHGKKLFIAPAEPTAPRDSRLADGAAAAQKVSQDAHAAALRDVGFYPSDKLAFANADSLVIALLRSLHELLPAVTLPISPELPPSLGSLFKGRDNMLAQIRRAFGTARPQGGVGCHPVAIWGPGGFGKTRLAVEYAHTHAHENSALLFVSAASEENLKNSLAELTGALKLSAANAAEREVRIKAALEWLENPAHKNWFLIIDNVDDEAAFTAVEQTLRRLRHGRVIITGRLRDWPTYVTALHLEVLSREHATEFLLDYTRDRRVPEAGGADADRAVAEQIAIEMGGLALALMQAGFAIRKRTLSFSGYLSEWHSTRDELLDDATFDPTRTDYPRTVAVTWLTSYKQVESRSPASARLFDALFWLAPDPIPERLVSQPWPQQALDALPEQLRDGLPRRRADLLIPLYDFCLADEPTSHYRLLSIHRVMQDVGRRWQRRGGTEAEGRTLAVALVLADFVRPGTIENLTLHILPELRQTAPHGLALFGQKTDDAVSTADRSRFHRELAEMRWAEGRLAEGLAAAQGAVESARKVCAADGEESSQALLAAALNTLASQLHSRGDFPSGFSAASEALTLMETLTEKEPDNLAHQRDLSIALNNVGRIRESQGQFGPALEVFERSQRIRETLTEKEPDNLAHQRELSIALNNVGCIREKQGQFGPALEVFERSQRICETLTEKEPDNLAHQRDLYHACFWCGRTCRKLGRERLADAERYLSQARQLAKGLLDVGWLRYGLASDLMAIEA